MCRAMLGVPLIAEGEPIGAFALARREPMPFSQREVELVNHLCGPGRYCYRECKAF